MPTKSKFKAPTIQSRLDMKLGTNVSKTHILAERLTSSQHYNEELVWDLDQLAAMYYVEGSINK